MESPRISSPLALMRPGGGCFLWFGLPTRIITSGSSLVNFCVNPSRMLSTTLAGTMATGYDLCSDPGKRKPGQRSARRSARWARPALKEA